MWHAYRITHFVPDDLKYWVRRNYGFHLHCYGQAHVGTAILTRETVEMEYGVPATLKGRVSHVKLKSGVHVFSANMPTQNAANHAKAMTFAKNLKGYMKN
jgi:hypothetical protein